MAENKSSPGFRGEPVEKISHENPPVPMEPIQTEHKPDAAFAREAVAPVVIADKKKAE